MKKRTLNLMQFFTLLTFALLLTASCKKDEVKEPYVGTWEATETITEEGISFQVKDIIILSKDKFTNKGQMLNPLTNKWIDIIGMKGELSINGDIMNLVVTDAGMTSYDGITGIPTGNITYYNESELGFEGLLADMEIPQTFSSQFFVTDNKITIKTDHNNDGDYTDENETTIYTKK